MAKKLKVSIVDQTTLKLEEKGDVGDLIDLQALQSVDNTIILQAIQSEKDVVYKNLLSKEIENQSKVQQLALNKQKEQFTSDYFSLKSEKQKLETQILELKEKIEEAKRFAVLETTNIKNVEFAKVLASKEQEINKLQNEVKAISDKQVLLIDKEKNDLKAKHAAQLSENEKHIMRLENQIQLLKFSEKEELSKKDADIKLLNEQMKNKDNLLKIELEKQKALLEQKYSEELAQKEAELLQLKFAKSNLQVKMLGEELERWCNSEYELFALSGFEDCAWYKDNVAVKDAPDAKATKADYIFEVYASAHKLKQEKLITVVCEMKNESPDTKTKTKNADHYKKLNDDRAKKNAQYSLLISELEWDTTNDAPIRKVADYENMYLVRPAYFITFLSLIKSLAKKYQALLSEHRIADETFKDSETIISEFEAFKKTYLDNPLLSLVKDVETIKKEATKSYEASYKIMGLADTIISNKVADIKLKIDRFDIKRIANKINRLSN